MEVNVTHKIMHFGDLLTIILKTQNVASISFFIFSLSQNFGDQSNRSLVPSENGLFFSVVVLVVVIL
jgi:hypothetical protein